MGDEETVQVADLDSFVRILTNWHNNRVATIKHLMGVPEGMEMQIGDEDPVILEGDRLKGFEMGLELALDNLGTLPFGFELEDAEPQTDEQPA